jgi:hypothetical protein
LAATSLPRSHRHCISTGGPTDPSPLSPAFTLNPHSPLALTINTPYITVNHYQSPSTSTCILSLTLKWYPQHAPSSMPTIPTPPYIQTIPLLLLASRDKHSYQWQLLLISIDAWIGHHAIKHRDSNWSITECSTLRYVEEDAYPRISERDRRLQSTLH